MVKVTDKPPKKVQEDLHRLSAALDANVPERRVDHNLVIASWNIRALGKLTKKWHSQPKDKPRRDFHAIRCIAEILSRFDVVALQEVKGDLCALRHVLRVLNNPDPHWGFILTDVTRGDAGNGERMAFLFDTRRVKPSGLASELVIPSDVRGVKKNALEKQFARTPYAVSFYSGGHTFILVTLHVIYGKGSRKKMLEARARELARIAGWLGDWARDMNAFDHDFIALGDFNIDRNQDPLYQAFTSQGLATPSELDDAPRTIFGTQDNTKHYDQIAWFTRNGKEPALSLTYNHRAGIFDFVPHVMTDLSVRKKSHRISDHYPLWAEFLIRDGSR